MNRRDFLKWLSTLPLFFQPALFAFFERLLWTPKTILLPSDSGACDKFTEFLIREQATFDAELLKDMRVTSWIGHVETGEWPGSIGGRFEHIFPDLTDDWQRADSGLLVPGKELA